MAIVLTKKKRVATPPTAPDLSGLAMLSPELAEIAELIDKVGDLQEEAAPIMERIKKDTEKLKPYKAAMKELQTKVDALENDPDDTVEQDAAKFRMEAGTKGTSRSIKSIEKAKKHLGVKTFMQLATIKLTDLDKYLTPPQLEEVLASERSSRTIKLFRREEA
ncbi:hypothetical protein JYP52_21245 [Nitratireductor aquibiodomus]|uniref:hypothetical protein n=1 Tax=Nitratireductor TaxID=245876 RepID=UPI000DE07FC0|nr:MULTISPECIES: hypothetical protein [Nitratireductor]MBN7763667.1 hypothetical protein [Nitratireductor aquibiodomus]